MKKLDTQNQPPLEALSLSPISPQTMLPSKSPEYPEKIQPVSVFIIAKNEADRIALTINSVKDLADEIIVVDSGSTDATMDVAKSLGAKVFFNEWNGYGAQKIFAEGKCKNDWLLNLDADEEISNNLRKSMADLFASGAITDNLANGMFAYRLRIKLVGYHQKKPHIFAPVNDPIRLYHKHYAGFRNHPTLDSVVRKNPNNKDNRQNDKINKKHILKLRPVVYHRSFRNLQHIVNKVNNYSDMQAKDLAKKGKYPSITRLLLEPPFAFIKAYFFRRFMFLGFNGLMISYIYVLGRMLRQHKMREILNENQAKKNSSQENQQKKPQ